MRWAMNQARSKLRQPELRGSSAVRPGRPMVRLLLTPFAPLLLLLFLALSPPVRAQSKSPAPTPSPKQDEQEIDPEDVISVNTTEVLLPVTVRDSAGLLVGNLTRKDFRIFEDGVEQPLSDLSLRQVPVDVVLMVDASSSVADNLDDFSRAAEGFAKHLAADDRISLIQFDDRILLLQDWTGVWSSYVVLLDVLRPACLHAFMTR